MDTQPLNVKIDSGSAQADLHALARALDETGAAANRMAAGMSQGMSGADRAIKGSMANMERFAQVAAAINKIKINSDGTKAVAEFAQVMNAVARTKEIEKGKIDSWAKFIQIGAQTSRLKMDGGAVAAMGSFIGVMDRAAKTRDISSSKLASWVKFIEVGARAAQLRGGGAAAMVGFNMFAQAMDNAAKTRAISQSKLKSWVDFIEVAARSQRLKFDPATARSLLEFGRAMEGFKAPGKGSIDRLDKMFKVLASAKPIPNARAVAHDLDMIAASATRAAAALSAMPGGRFNLGGGGRRRGAAAAGGGGGDHGPTLNSTASGAGKAGGSLGDYSAQADKAGKSSYTLGERLRGLNHRFDLAYQASTLFTHAFGAFTIGGLIKGVYDANIELQKLEKAMLFSTKSAEGSKRATQEFIGTVFDMGLALDQVAEPFGRFTISAGAAGMSAQDSSAIFRSVTQTLQVVGASAEQTGYAMYGLTQMIQKGKVSSEEFSRQIGEQIPGNAEAGRRALERMKGEAVSTAQFFKEMSLGKIMSPEFTKLWAEELNTMFGGLMGLVKDRPDVALNRLKTAFTVFQQEIGKSGFIAELGVQFSRLAEMFGTTENGVFKLKPKFQDLAKQLGQNLASMTRKAADAAAWLAENFDKVMFAGKAIATLFVAKTFLSWGQSAMTAMGSITQLTKAITGLAIAKKAVEGSDIAGDLIPAARGRVKTNGPALAADAALSGATMVDIQNWRNARGHAPGGGRLAQMNAAPAVPPMSGFGRRARFSNIARPTGATADVLAMRSAGLATQTARTPLMSTLGAGAMTAARAAPTAALGALKTGAMALGVTFGALGVAAVGVGAALAILSDETTKLGNNTVKYGDIMKGWLSGIGDKMGTWFQDLFGRMLGTGSVQESLDAMGMAFQSTTVLLSYLGEVLGDTIGVLVHLGVAAYKTATGDVAGAKAEMGAMAQDWSDNGMDSIQKRMTDGITATLTAANKRREGERSNEAAAERLREAERQLQAQKAADDQLRAANLQLEAANKLKDNFKVPTVNSVMERINALANGSFDRANPSMTAEQRTAQNVETARAAQAAAPAAAPTAAAAGSRQTYTQVIGGKRLTAGSQEDLAKAIFDHYQAAGPNALAPNFGTRTRPPGAEAPARPGSVNALMQNPLVRGGLRVAGAMNPALGLATNMIAPQSSTPLTQETRAAWNRDYAAHTAARTVAMTNDYADQRAAMGGVAVPAQYRAAMTASATKNGVDPAVMARLIAAESTWNKDVAGTGGDAVGLGQFTMGTWNRVMKDGPQVTSRTMGAADPRRNANLNMEATARYMAENQAALRDVLKRDANAGEQYLAHFLGTSGAKNMLAKYAQDPTQTVAQARVGNQDQYNKNPVFKNGSTTLQELYNWGQRKVGQSGQGFDTSGVTGVAAAAADDIEKDQNKHLNTWKAMQSILALPDPASQANASFDAMLEKLNDIAAADEELRKKNGPNAALVTSPIRDQISAAIARQAKELQDAMNPVSKANRLARETNDLTLKTLQGMGKEAEWQERINEMKEQGYPIELMQDEAKWTEHVNGLRLTGKDIQVESLNTARQQWEMERDRTKALEAQVRLMDTLNEAQMRVGKASGVVSNRDTYLNDLINQSVQGGTFDQKRAQVEANPALLTALSRTADVQAMSDQAESLRSIIVELSDGIDSATDKTMRGYRASYRDILRDLTNMPNATLAQLEAAEPVMAKLAKTLAEARHTIENPPGFAAWVDGLEPFARRMENIKGAFMEGLSDGITDELMGEDVDWQAMFKNIRRQIVKATVDDALSGMLGVMGVKKPGSEAQAGLEAATAQYNAAVAMIDKTKADAQSDLAAQQALVDAQKNQQDAINAEVKALTDAANALKTIAAYFDPDGAISRVLNTTAESTLNHAGGVRSGAISTGLLNKPAPAVAAAPAGPLDYVQGLMDRTMTSLGLKSPALGGEVMDPMAPVSLRPIMSSLGRMTPARAVQGHAPATPHGLGAERDTTPLWRKAFNLIGGETSPTSETTKRMSTTSSMGTAPSAGPVMLSGDDAGAGYDQAATALYTAAQMLMQVPTTFNTAAEGFKTQVEAFGEAVKKLEKAAAVMAKGGGKGDAKPSAKPSLGDATEGFTFEGKAFAPDLTGLYADGGYVSGRGGPRSDDINARLSNGEFVINAAATSQNRALLEAINNGKAYANGGLVDGLPGFAGGGWFSDMLSSAKTNFGEKFTKPTMSNVFGRGKNGKADSPLSFVGEMFGKGRTMEERGAGFMQGAALISTLADLFKKEKAPEKDPEAVKGVIGEHRGVTVDATAIAAHSNPIADVINFGANILTGGTWGKVGTYMEMASGVMKQFADGGYVSNAGMDWGKAPHYDVGTANTSNGGMPAIVHPNEAIIPLPNGRAVPVDMGNVPSGGANVTSNITVIAPNPDAFRKSQGSIQRQQNRDLKRASTRNLS
ncbi:putative tail tape measure protein [Brevundimonas phage vB_BpoS-Domovoi]|uniref:Tail tape measure protein n=1 Tax=Brevundimonas phage vB_BpoS-Domovoi TaxID=2948598 RepID=A0A9E7MRR9_9CAUD|nr:putative tail tape measure protein [Brevundimonas phage vB_BpoS-Domovoi]